MRWRRRFEPLALLVPAVLVPLVAAGWLLSERRAVAVERPPADVPHAEALASPREDRSLSPERWLELALDAPRRFHRALGWCERRRQAPLPNCRNMMVADRVCQALGTVELLQLSGGAPSDG